MKFLIVDAFTTTTFGGNPAGVVILPDGQDFPDENTMLATAAELRYSETAFIKPLGNSEFQIRYFTPAAEVDLCGHATIGSFCALLKLGIVKSGEICVNHTLAGDLKIAVSDDAVLMDMASPVEIKTISDSSDTARLYSVMGTSFNSDLHFPRIISTGLPDIIMEVSSREELNKMEPDMKAMAQLSDEYKVIGVHAFALDSEDGATAHCRNFAPLYDIDEEAATGTANGGLTYFLYLNNLIKSGAHCRIIQGESMNRPSEILTEIISNGQTCNIKVGGSAVILAEGEINI